VIFRKLRILKNIKFKKLIFKFNSINIYEIFYKNLNV
jgi:hypothetical protein